MDNILVPDVIPSFSRKLDESSIDMLQEENINDVCNEAFDELLTQEFNPNQEDFEHDHEDDTLKEAESVEPGWLQYIFPLYLLCSRLRSGNPKGIFNNRHAATLGFLLFFCCVSHNFPYLCR
jgi:hypothetical protein